MSATAKDVPGEVAVRAHTPSVPSDARSPAVWRLACGAESHAVTATFCTHATSTSAAVTYARAPGAPTTAAFPVIFLPAGRACGAIQYAAAVPRSRIEGTAGTR